MARFKRIIMIIGSGGYASVFHPPRYPKKYKGKSKYIQRFTDQSRTQIADGEYARKIFDPSDKISSPLIAMYPRKNDFFSLILPYREGSLYHLLNQLKHHRRSTTLFRTYLSSMLPILQGLVRLHKKGWIHHDIKSSNFLYDMKPLRFYLADWATTLSFRDVFSLDYSHWHSGHNENSPPEYKIFAHALEHYFFLENDFVKDYRQNNYYHILLFVQPNYDSLLRRAYTSLTKKLHGANLSLLLEKMAPQVDVFAMGMVLCQIFAVIGQSSLLRESFLRLARGMIQPDPFQRWTMKKSASYLASMLSEEKKK